MLYQDDEFPDGFLKEDEEGESTDPSEEEFLEPEKEEEEEEWEEE
jgi:hypothetical protein